MTPNRSVSAKLNKSTRCLRLILGDQLNAAHSWFRKKDPAVVYLICELKQETDYVKHHTQKIAAFFSAMENFAKALSQAGHQVIYLTLDETDAYSGLKELINTIVEQHQLTRFGYQQPDEFRLQQQLQSLNLSIDTEKVDSEHFLLSHQDIEQKMQKNKHTKLEFFYRKLRKEFNILMENGSPIGGKWNYDADNRHSLKAADIKALPKPMTFNNDVSKILKRIKKHRIKTFGECNSNIVWPVTRRQSRQLLTYFCQKLLPHFGQFQDAMTENSPHAWSLYHSRLSFALNAKMLSPKEVINQAIETWENNRDSISLSQIEGFVRQILGWREFIRAVYWCNMPEYAKHNQLRAKRDLPAYFWDGNTKMNCLKRCIEQSLKTAYAHHIQRLMVTGNFCLLAGVHPDQIDDWYLGIYIDAIEWVEMPNTRGMTQFADNGIIATKPYCSSGSYINKMSDYCKTCSYKVNKKTEDDACPFNALYWHFLHRHRDKLQTNGRMNMIYNVWNKMSNNKQQALLARGDWCLKHLEEL